MLAFTKEHTEIQYYNMIKIVLERTIFTKEQRINTKIILSSFFAYGRRMYKQCNTTTNDLIVFELSA